MAIPSLEIAVLDRQGVIVRVNEAWRRFARENGAPELAEHSVGLNYLELCRTVSGPEAETSRTVAEGIVKVLDGTLPSFSLEYPCHSQAEQRYFRLDIAPLARLADGGVLITHTKLAAFRRRGALAEQRATRASQTLGALANEIAQITGKQTGMLGALATRRWARPTPPSQSDELHGIEGELTPRFVGLLDTFPDPIALYGTTGHLVRVNHAYMELFALDRNPSHLALSLAEQMQRLQVRDIATGRPLEVEETAAMRALRGEALTGKSALDVCVSALDGREVEVNVSASPVYAGGHAGGHIVGAFVAMRDVTEHRRMERELAASARRMEATLHTMQDGVVLTDAQDGRILLSNPAFKRLFAIDRDPTLLLLPPKERGARLAFRHPDSGQPLTAEEMPATQALRGHVLAGSQMLEIHACALDGHELDLSVSAAPLRNGDNHIVGAVAVYRDVTERRELERERGRMINLVAHELRHPLAILRMVDGLIRKGFAPSETPRPKTTPHEMAPHEMAPHENLPPEKVRELLDFMDRGVEEMERLIEDLVDAAHIESGHLALDVAPTDLAALVRQVAEDEMRLKGSVIRVEAPQRRVMVPLDRTRITQVLSNLLTNAYKYSPANTPVQVHLRRRRGDVCVEVHNEGPEIPREAQAHLFERFFRVPGTIVLRGPQGGLGLGLYVCHQLVQLHGGQIGVDSGAGRGVTFWFTLPLMQKPNQKPNVATEGT